MTRWTGALAGGVLWGIAAALVMPRGPLTNAQAVWSVVVSAGVGVLAGRVSRSRWAMLAVPVAFWAAMELSRTGVRGPSVDAFHPSPFGVLAFVTGRGTQALLTAVPMVLGAAWGAGIARRHSSGSRWRRAVTGVLSAGMLLVTVAAAIPARTAGIPGGVAELTTVPGRDLNLMIRGGGPELPVLLFVPGSPGGSELGAMRKHLSALERHFIVATLDRRGGGASYPALDRISAVNVGSEVEDIGAVTDYLRQRFRQERIYLLGHSGGSIPSVLAVRDHPERYRAYIGTGQGVDVADSDRHFYADILAWARATGRDDVARRLADQGPPPYDDVYGYETIMTYGPEAYGQSGGAFDVGVPEYTLLEKVHTLTGILDTWDARYPSVRDVDLRADAPRLGVPVYFVQGADEMRGLAVVFDDWYARLRAPSRRLEVLPGAGHRAMFEQPDRFTAILTRVLAETGGVSAPPGR